MFYSARTQGIGEQGQLEGQPSEKTTTKSGPFVGKRIFSSWPALSLGLGAGLHS